TDEASSANDERPESAETLGDSTKVLEGCPSGQREQTVNLPAMPSMVRIHHPPPRISITPSQHPCLSSSHPDRSIKRKAGIVAGVAQLVERQPSKLNVAGSNPVSRSEDTSHPSFTRTGRRRKRRPG